MVPPELGQFCGSAHHGTLDTAAKTALCYFCSNQLATAPATTHCPQRWTEATTHEARSVTDGTISATFAYASDCHCSQLPWRVRDSPCPCNVNVLPSQGHTCPGFFSPCAGWTFNVLSCCDTTSSLIPPMVKNHVSLNFLKVHRVEQKKNLAALVDARKKTQSRHPHTIRRPSRPTLGNTPRESNLSQNENKQSAAWTLLHATTDTPQSPRVSNKSGRMERCPAPRRQLEKKKKLGRGPLPVSLICCPTLTTVTIARCSPKPRRQKEEVL